MPLEWISATVRPPVDEDYLAFTHSIEVLVTDGKKIWAGYLCVWEDDEYEAQWKMQGPDGWNLEGITHWMPFPELPVTDNSQKGDPDVKDTQED